MANKRLYQIFSARESQPGVLASSLIAAGNGTVQVKDPVFTFNVEEYEREINTGSASPGIAINGRIKAEISFAVELAGTTHETNAPPWAHLLEACGFRKPALYGGTWSGTFGGTASGTAKALYTGQLLRNAGNTNVLRVIHDTYEGQTVVYFEVVTGVGAAELLYPVASDATAGPTITITAGQPAVQKGYAWVPTSRNVSTSDVTLTSGAATTDDILVGATSGAVLRVLEPITTGSARKFEILDGTPTSTGEAYNNKTAGATGVVTTPGTSTWTMVDVPTVSIGIIEDGRVKVASGCRGTVTFSGEPGQPIFMNFNFTGLLSSISTAGAISGITYISKVPPKLQGVPCVIGSFTSTEPGYMSYATAHPLKLQSMTLDYGANANIETDVTQSTGYSGVAAQTGRRATQASFKVGQRPEAAFQFARKQRDSEPFWFKLRFTQGSTTANANNAFLFSSPGIFVTGMSSTETDGYASDELSCKATSRHPDGTEGEGGELVLSYHYSAVSTW